MLACVAPILNLSWSCSEVADPYCPDNSRPGIELEVAVPLLSVDFVAGIVHEHTLMR